MISTQELRKMLRPRPADGHKGTFGHALLVAGSRGMAGAAILASEACLRSGIGKLSILSGEDNRTILQITVPEAILTREIGTNLPYQAIGIGPGIGTDNEAKDIVYKLLFSGQMPKVFDADAINILAKKPEWQPLLPKDAILTPHVGEAERLIGSGQLEDVADFARRRQICVILKGHPTHVFLSSGEVVVMEVGNSGMGTAGSGDVLTGLITGLLAQGYSPSEAAQLGVWLHGTAGDFAADEMGENCMLARDIIRHLPQAFKKLKIED